jgi:hypothetical protein
VDGRYRIVSQPPIVIPARDLAAAAGVSSSEVDELVRDQFRAYRATLRDDQRHLLERFQIVDMARKVVGVGATPIRTSVTTRSSSRRSDPDGWKRARVSDD